MQDHIISFTAGILSAVSPCILPVIPVVNYYLLYMRIPSSIILILVGILLLSEKPSISIIAPPAENHVLLGLLTAIAWTPCYSPYLIGVIASSAYSGIAGALINMALYTLGITITLIAVALMSETLLGRLLRASRDLRRASGVLITFAGIYMLYQLIPLT